MAKYVVAIASSRRAGTLRDLFGLSSWTSEGSHGPWTILVHTDAAGRHLDASLSLFKGWYIDHAGERLVFAGPEHAFRPAPERPMEGCYVVTRLSGGVLALGHDLFCQLPLLHFCEADVFVASDSIFTLSEVRKALGLRCRLEEEVARARAWTRTLGQQNQSERTLLADVGYAGVGTWLAVDLSRGALAAEVHRTGARELFADGHASHADAVREAAVRMGRHIASFAAAGRLVSCSLSGGQDSRAVVAAASLVASHGGEIAIATNERLPRDFEVASSLAAVSGLKVGRRPGSRLAGPRGTQLSRWLAHSAGLYDRFEYAADRNPADGVFTMGGHGGELSKGMWRWWRIDWLTWPAPLRAALRAECDRGLRAMGLTSRDRWSAEWHYLGYRNAIHGGRSSARYLLNSSPLMQRTLASLAHSGRSERRPWRHGGPSIVTDLTIMLRPDMAAHRYSRRAAFISKGYVDARLRELGGPVDRRDLVPYRLVGDPLRAAIRSSPVFADRAAGFAGAAGEGAKGQVGLALAGAERCPPGLRDLYDPMARRVRAARPGDAATLAPLENSLAAKLAALHLLD